MQAEKGDKVKVHYTGTFTDGTVFDSSVNRSPLGFEVGAGQMIAGFDKAVIGMAVNDKKTVTLPPEEAYGAEIEENFISVPNENIPADLNPAVGDKLMVNNHPVRVHKVMPDGIILNANHEMAGKELIFEIKMIEIEKAGSSKPNVDMLPDY